MISTRSGGMRIVFVTLAACLVSAACGQTTPPKSAVVTPSPTATATPKPTPTPTATPTAEITADTSAAASASAGAAASASAAASPSTGPSASATSAAAGCTGSADNQAWFVETAGLMKFSVYCAALPAKWYLSGGAYTQPKGGTVTITYKKTGGGQLDISEGAFCSGACNTHVATLGTAAFGGLTGELDLYSASPDVYVIYVNPGTATAYTIKGSGMTQSAFTGLAATMIKVPKP